MNQQVVVVNEKDEIQGQMPRSEAHANGTPHRIAVVYVENGNGQIVVQTRMSGRLDHSAAGHLDVGESYIDAAKRELREELGIEDVQLTKIGHGASSDIKSDQGINIRHVFDIFCCVAKPGLLQQTEVKGIRWDDPVSVWNDMKSSNADKYAGGFRASLEVYLKYKKLI